MRYQLIGIDFWKQQRMGSKWAASSAVFGPIDVGIARFCRSKLLLAGLRKDEGIDRNASCFVVNGKLETILQEDLDHGSHLFHLFGVAESLTPVHFGAGQPGLYIIFIGVEPIRAARNLVVLNSINEGDQLAQGKVGGHEAVDFELNCLHGPAMNDKSGHWLARCIWLKVNGLEGVRG